MIARLTLVLILAALLVYPPVERALGGILASSQDGIAVAAYPHALHQQISRGNGVYLKYTQIPSCLEQAIISVEDKRFFSHGGIDPIAVVRVLLKDVKNDHKDHGGSTITQQLAHIVLDIPHRRRNALSEITTQLRILKAALIIEHDFSKQSILELYLNGAYFGRGATGAEAAAQAYFGTSLGRLDKGRCVYLAGLVQAPSLFGANPAGARAKARYRHVIATMERNGFLSKNQALALDHEHLFSTD